MTAYGTIEQAVAAMREGAVDYLVKPFEAEELERRVARYLRSGAEPRRAWAECPSRRIRAAVRCSSSRLASRRAT